MRSSGSSTYHINKLTEINYRSWAQQVKWILDERDLWELVIGVEPMPGTVSVVTSEDYDQKLAAWNKKAKKARINDVYRRFGQSCRDLENSGREI